MSCVRDMWILQAESGLWHQVLNDPEAYLEASCTAMFAYAFARGVRFGLARGAQRLSEAALKAWDGLTRIAIDAPRQRSRCVQRLEVCVYR